MKGKKSFDEDYKLNRAIIGYPAVPIYDFVRCVSVGPYGLA
jgi:hypothetical protein